ncbi:MAG: VCBS repeat-containing protein [Planctomycetes bacterium]|nr:VCBS repeat-containing protein [Planctomycetota bacterium]
MPVSTTLLPPSLLGLLTAIATAQSAPPIPVELRARFGFEGPSITKIGDGIDDLTVADTDGDGRLEAVIADARRARLAVVHVDGDGETTVDSIPTNGQIGGYTWGDFDGDGRSDLLMTDSRGRLQLYHTATKKSEELLDLGLGGRGVGMYAGDLDGDGKADLVAISRDGMRHVTRLTTTPELSRIEPWEEKAHSFQLMDLDADGHLDMLYVVATPTMNLRLRRGRGDGTFGPWQLASIDNLRHVFPARLADGSEGLATIDGPNRRVTLQKFAPTGGQAALEWWSLPDSQANRGLPFAVGDFDNDGDDDLVMAQPERAQLLFFEWQNGTFVMQTVPTFAGVASLDIGDVDQDGKLDLVLASPEEETLAWKSGALPIDAFPEQIACTDSPNAAAVAPDGGVIVLVRSEKREGRICRTAPGAEPIDLADLGRLPAAPSRLLLADVGDAPGIEAAFVVPNEGLRIVTLGDGSEAKAVDKKSSAAGFTKKMDDGALLCCERDGKPALMAVRDRFVRRFRVGTDGQLEVLDQDNGPAGVTELSLAAELGDKSRVYLDRKADKLIRVGSDGTPTSIDVPPMPFTHVAAHGSAVLLLGPRGVLRVPFGPGPALQTVAIHEPPTVRTAYWHGFSGDFDSDGTADLVLIDGQLPGLQILAGGETLERALAIPVFEAPPSEDSNPEPHDLEVGDLDGDGRTDIVILAFDRVLVYRQQK